jgi:arylsulfatase
MLGNRAIYHDGWVAATTPPSVPWDAVPKPVAIDDYEWELYDVAADFSQSRDLATEFPKKLRQLQDLFWAEAARYNALPIDNTKVERLDVSNRPSLTRGRESFTYFPGMVRITEGVAPDVKNKSFIVSADLEAGPDKTEGVLITQGGRFSGWGLYVVEGKPVFHYNLAGVSRYEVMGSEPLQPGKHTIEVSFKYDGGGLGKGGTATMMVDGAKIAEGRIERTLPFRMSLDETLDIGEDTGTPVSEAYHVPFKFTGNIEKVTVKLEQVSGAEGASTGAP